LVNINIPKTTTFLVLWFVFFAQLCGYELEARTSPVLPNARAVGGYQRFPLQQWPLLAQASRLCPQIWVRVWKLALAPVLPNACASRG